MKSKKYNSTENSFRAQSIRIKIEGFGLERIVSELVAKKIEIRKLRYISETELELTVTQSGYRRAKRIAGKRYRITVVRKSGLIPLVNGMKLRKATLVGLALFFIIIYYQSLFVSEIRITGYESLTEAEIRTALANIDFEEGSRKLTTKKEINAVKLYLFQTLENLTWVGITYDGTLAEIEVVEGQAEAQKKTEQEITDMQFTPCHVIADKSGYIAKIIATSGRRAVEDGAYVEPGDILISGIVPITSTAYGTPAEDITERYVHADGLVEIYVPHRIAFTIVPNIVDSRQAEDVVSAVKNDDENEYDFVKRIANKEIRKYIAENAPETAQVVEKSLSFSTEKSIINVSMFFKTLEKIGIKQEIQMQIQEIANDSEQPI